MAITYRREIPGFASMCTIGARGCTVMTGWGQGRVIVRIIEWCGIKMKMYAAGELPGEPLGPKDYLDTVLGLCWYRYLNTGGQGFS